MKWKHTQNAIHLNLTEKPKYKFDSNWSFALLHSIEKWKMNSHTTNCIGPHRISLFIIIVGVLLLFFIWFMFIGFSHLVCVEMTKCVYQDMACGANKQQNSNKWKRWRAYAMRFLIVMIILYDILFVIRKYAAHSHWAKLLLSIYLQQDSS